MTPSVYVVGGAGSGKSTFTASLLASIGGQAGPLVDLHTAPNARGSLVTLRGHELAADPVGLYLGVLRESFPGTDGLDRASSITGEAWLLDGGADAYSYVVGEGATLATRRFLYALSERTNMLLVHLYADEFVTDLRFRQRGSVQDEGFVKNTVTRSRNLWVEMMGSGVATLSIDTCEPAGVSAALACCLAHLA